MTYLPLIHRLRGLAGMYGGNIKWSDGNDLQAEDGSVLRLEAGNMTAQLDARVTVREALKILLQE